MKEIINSFDKKKMGRPKDPVKSKRVKLTTAVRSDLIKKLKQQALDQNKTLADVLEGILTSYYPIVKTTK